VKKGLSLKNDRATSGTRLTRPVKGRANPGRPHEPSGIPNPQAPRWREVHVEDKSWSQTGRKGGVGSKADLMGCRRRFRERTPGWGGDIPEENGTNERSGENPYNFRIEGTRQ